MLQVRTPKLSPRDSYLGLASGGGGEQVVVQNIHNVLARSAQLLLNLLTVAAVQNKSNAVRNHKRENMRAIAKET